MANRVLRVVAAVIERDGKYLITQRRDNAVLPGLWEFPGGKVEPGETIEQALRRELLEEIGVTIGAAHAWRVERVDYPHALVRLNFCKVFDWQGELHMHEGQSFAWETLPVQSRPVLPGTVPVLEWFAQERGFTGATHTPV
jgi:8-oxo-dGTP diphosphatase